MDILKSFLITIDTEGDDIWSKRSSAETRNASFLPRLQSVCEKFGLKPTYPVNYEMANDCGIVEFGRDVIARGVGEIGMHLRGLEFTPNPSPDQQRFLVPTVFDRIPRRRNPEYRSPTPETVAAHFRNLMLTTGSSRPGVSSRQPD